MNIEVRLTLLWLAKRLDEIDKAAGGGDPFLVHNPCGHCGHSRYAHVVDGSADDPTPWPCEYPRILGGPVALCYCEDFVPMSGPDE